MLVLNFLIFINRKNGFNYQSIASLEQLYPPNELLNDPKKLKGTTTHFTPTELASAKQLILGSTDFIHCKTDIERLLCINHFLYQSICQNHAIGKLTTIYDDPMQLFLTLRANKQEPFDCGPTAFLHTYFLTAMGFNVRNIQNIQRPDAPIAPNSHVFNEVWIGDKNIWVISDLFQNRHLLVKNGIEQTAADFYRNQALENGSAYYTIYQSENGLLTEKTEKISDPFFSRHYYLNYYRETDPSIVYSWKKKIQHYILSYSHFQLYDPIEHRSNARYHLKQFVFFAGLGWLIIFVVGTIRYFFDRSKKHTKIL
ncbi:MAG: hypothetical protein RL750_418 [Bacteroidota bacterium]